MTFDLAHTLLLWARMFLLAWPIAMLAVGDDLEVSERDQFDYVTPRDLGVGPYDPSEFGE